MEIINLNPMEELHIKKIVLGGILVLFLSGCFCLIDYRLNRQMFLPSSQINIQQPNGEIASLVDFDVPNISFYCNSSPVIYNLLPFNQISTRQKKIVTNNKRADGDICFVKSQVVSINKNSIYNAADYLINDRFHITMPDTIYKITRDNRELFYFVSFIRDNNLWYIGILFKNGEKYKLHSFVANSFDYDRVSFNLDSDHLLLLLGKGVHQGDSTTFTKYDITVDGHINKMILDSVVVNRLN